MVSYGMNPVDLFEANDLFESGNMTQVQVSLLALAGKVRPAGRQRPSWSPALWSTGVKRRPGFSPARGSRHLGFRGKRGSLPETSIPCQSGPFWGSLEPRQLHTQPLEA